MAWIDVLEMTGFGGSVCAMLVYDWGNGYAGPLLSMLFAVVIIVWGLYAGAYFASFFSVAFFIAHANNLRLRIRRNGSLD